MQFQALAAPRHQTSRSSDSLVKLVMASRAAVLWLALMLALAGNALAIPRFDSAFHQGDETTGMMEEFFADGVPSDIQLLGFSQRQVIEFYEERRFQPSFWQSFGWEPSLLSAFDVIHNADNHALNPEEYASAGMRVAPKLGDSNTDIAAFDAQLTILMARFAHDLAVGRHNPDPNTNGLELMQAGLAKIDAQEDLSFGEWYQSIAPNTPTYQRLLELYHSVSTTISPSAVEVVIPEGPLLKLGIDHEHVALLREYLVGVGLLDAGDGNNSPTLFDADLDAALRQFQAVSGVMVDGQVGNQTRRRIAESDLDLMPKILVNLERLRWEDPLESSRHIRVNIASQHLQAYDNLNLELDMRVVVGRTDRPTPLMSDRITNLKFAPDWTVPRSIFTADYLGKIRQDVGFIQSAGYQIKQGGKIIDPTNIDWQEEGVQNRVTLYKPSSSYGPLGGVRFSLTNDQAIYLHDTSSPHLFDRAERERSSGCVRVHQPAALSEFILKETDWSPPQIREAMNGNDTQYARPNDEVQVYLSYLTLWVDDDGALQTARDPYQLDEELMPFFEASTKS